MVQDGLYEMAGTCGEPGSRLGVVLWLQPGRQMAAGTFQEGRSGVCIRMRQHGGTIGIWG